MKLSTIDKIVAMKCDKVGKTVLSITFVNFILTRNHELLSPHQGSLVRPSSRRQIHNEKDQLSYNKSLGNESPISINNKCNNS
jgi:hypothetical protein